MSDRPKYRVRIESDGTRLGTRVIDADTGCEVMGVLRVEFDLDAGREEFATVRIDVVAEIDVTVDGEVRRLRLDAESGQYFPIGVVGATEEPASE